MLSGRNQPTTLLVAAGKVSVLLLGSYEPPKDGSKLHPTAQVAMTAIASILVFVIMKFFQSLIDSPEEISDLLLLLALLVLSLHSQESKHLPDN